MNWTICPFIRFMEETEAAPELAMHHKKRSCEEMIDISHSFFFDFHKQLIYFPVYTVFLWLP